MMKNHTFAPVVSNGAICTVCLEFKFHEYHSPFQPALIVDTNAPNEGRIDFLNKRNFEQLSEYLKTESKEKEYEPPFPYETQEPVPGTYGAILRNNYPILSYIENSLKMDAVVSALRVIDDGMGHLRFAANRVGQNCVVIMGIPVEIDPMMEPGTWKLVVSKLPTQMCDINR